MINITRRMLENVIVAVGGAGIILVVAWLITCEKYFAVVGLFLGVSLIILAQLHWRTIRRKPL